MSLFLSVDHSSPPFEIFPASGLPIETPADLFFEQLRELHAMEVQLGQALPALVGMASDRELKDSISMHTFRTGKRAARLESIFLNHGVELGSTNCTVIGKLLEHGERNLGKIGNNLTRDMMMVAHCQRIQHQGVASYLVASRLACCLDMTREADLLGAPKVEHQTAIRKLEGIGSRLFGEIPMKVPSGGIYDTARPESVAV